MRPALTPRSRHLALLGLLWAMPAWSAEALDPTRPPAPPMPAPAVAAAGAGEDRTAAAGDAATPALVLQSLHLPHSGDATAIISGRLYRVGDRLGAETITRIDAHGVVLKGPTATRGLTPYGVLALNIEPAPRTRTALARRPAVPPPTPEAPTQARWPMSPAPAPAARARSVALVSRGALSLRLDLGDDSPATPLRPAVPMRLQTSHAPRPLPWAMPAEGTTPSRPAALSAALASVADFPPAGVIPARLPSSPPVGGFVPR
jgi:hypothetical protein